MLIRYYDSADVKERLDNRKPFERKNSNTYLQSDDSRAGYQVGPIR